MMETAPPFKWKHPKFDYLEARTAEEACSLLFDYGGRAKIIAGGTDLLVAMRRQKLSPTHLISIKTIDELRMIRFDGRVLQIGALCSLTDVETSPMVRTHFPIVARSAHCIGTPQIRNAGTIGGNLCNAAPSADMAPSLIGLEATAVIKGRRGERTIRVEEFFSGPGKSVLGRDEILVGILLQTPAPGSRGVYIKLPARTAKDIALAGVAAVFDSGSNQVRIALSSVAPTPMRAREAEFILNGQDVSDERIQEAALAAADEARPISDVRGTAKYRREMIRVLTAEALRQVMVSSLS